MNKFNGLFSKKKSRTNPKFFNGGNNPPPPNNTMDILSNPFGDFSGLNFGDNLKAPAGQAQPNNIGLDNLSTNPSDDMSYFNPNAKSYASFEDFRVENPTAGLTDFDKQVMDFSVQMQSTVPFNPVQSQVVSANQVEADKINQANFEKYGITTNSPFGTSNVDPFVYNDKIVDDSLVPFELENNQQSMAYDPMIQEEQDRKLEELKAMQEGEEALPQDRQERRSDVLNYLSSYNPYGFSTESALFKAGQSLAFDPNDPNLTKQGQQRAKTGNLVRGIGAFGKSALGIAKNIASGAGYQNRLQEAMRTYNEKQRENMVGRVSYAEDGGVQGNNLPLPLFENGGVSKLDMEKYLTGEYVSGLPKHSEHEATAEVEQGEYLQREEGEIQEVIGDNHEKGGEKVNLAEGELVVSNNLKLSQGDVDFFKKEFDIKLSTKDTYAKAIKKYTKKVGLEDLVVEHEKLNRMLEEQEHLTDDPTAEFNREFLADKISDLEQEKQPLLEQRKNFFNAIFDKQEESKGTTEEAPVQEEMPMFRKGGMQHGKAFKALCKKHGLTEEEGLKLINSKKYGGVQKYDDGGSVYGDEAVGRIMQRRSKYLANRPDFDDLTTQRQGLVKWIKDLEKLGFDTSKLPYDPETVEEDKEKFGKIAGAAQKWVNSYAGKSTLDYSKQAELTKTGIATVRQKVKEGRLDELGYNDKQKKDIMAILNDKSKINSFDFLPTQLTALRDILSEDEVVKSNFIDDEWYYRRPEFKDVTFKDKAEYEKFIAHNTDTDVVGDKQYFSVGQGVYINPIFGEDEVVETQEAATQDLDLPLHEEQQSALMFPDQSTLPPEGLQAHLKVKRRFDKLDPVKVSYEDNLVEMARQEEAMNNELNKIPDAQRQAVLASTTASTQGNINKVIAETNRANAMNKQNVDQFNIQQASTEENYLAADALDYERRQLTALAKTQDDLARYFDYMRDVNVNRFKEQNMANLVGSMYENYDISPTGQVVQDKSTGYQFQVPKFNLG